jgi:hypothetical protein
MMMHSRSLVHMLSVLAKRLEIENAPADIVKALGRVAADKTIRAAEHRNWNTEEQRRTERQRTLFAMLPSCDAVDRLKAAMLQRAYDLLWDGDALGCDAIIEFVPSKDADQMLKAWMDDQDNEQPRSRFYNAKAAA